MTMFARGRHAALREDKPVDRLEVYMHSAVAKVDAALDTYRESRNVQHLIDGLLDVRNRLTKGLPT